MKARIVTYYPNGAPWRLRIGKDDGTFVQWVDVDTHGNLAVTARVSMPDILLAVTSAIEAWRASFRQKNRTERRRDE